MPHLSSFIRWFPVFLLLLPGRAMAQQLPVERVSISTDQEVYIAGDLLWITAWCGQSFPTEIPLSTVLYVELLDGQGQAVMQAKLALEAGRAHAGLDLPDLLPTGHYFLRAYTQFQRNFPAESYATRLITILNPTLESVPMAVLPEPPLAVRFEQGQPLANTLNRLVVRVSEPGCQPQDLRIIDAAGKMMAEPKLVSGSLALFEVGLENAAYAVICTTASASLRLDLPSTALAGCGVTVEREASKLIVTLKPGSTSPQADWQLQLLGPDFQPVATQPVGTSLRLEVPASDLLPGLHPLLISNGKGEILYAGSYRWAQPAPAATLALDAGATPRSQWKAEVRLPANLSGALTARKSVPWPVQHTGDLLWANPWMAPHLMLADGTMPGTGLEPIAEVLYSAYLSEQPAMLGKEANMTWPPESRDLSVSGVVRTGQTKEPVKNALVLLSVVGEYPQIHAQRTGEDGSFRLALRDLEGIETLYAGVQPMEGRQLELLVNRDFSAELPRIIPLPLRFDPLVHQHFEALWIAFQTRQRWEKPATTPAYSPREINPLPINLGQPDVVVNVNDFINLPTMEEVFRNIVPKVTLTGEPGKRQLAVYEDLTMRNTDNPLVLLDYAAIFDIEALLELPTARLARVEVYQGSYVLGDQQFGGVVSLFTNTDDFARYPLARNGSFVSFATRQTVNSFELVTSPPALYQPDLRSVLAWYPQLTGQQMIGPWTGPDPAGTYEVLLQGCDQQGACWTWRASATQR